MKIYDARVNHMTNPLGFMLEGTVFSWKVKEAQGKKQKEARILVWKDKDGKAEIIKDTGFVEGLESIGQRIDLKLSPYTKYFWTVTVVSDVDEEATSEVQWFETAKMDDPWKASWITCDNCESRHPIFFKDIKFAGPVKKATLYISGLGLYYAYFNGEKIGDEFFTPYCNNYNGWVQYQTYNMTDMLKEEGRLSVLLGNGWYKGRFGFSQHSQKGFYGDRWHLICELRLEYEDGLIETISSDDTWKVERSNITFSNLYDGEHLDDTLDELPIEDVQISELSTDLLSERLSLPVVEREILKPIELITTPKNEKVFDMGQILTGIFRLRLNVPKGRKIHIQTGEILQENSFYNGNLRSAKSEYFYVSDGKKIVLEPKFTFYGFRYIKVDGVDNLDISDMEAVALYSDFEEVGHIETGHKDVNKLVSNVRWSMKGNFLDVPTDCPQRDERMGWTGDAQIFTAAATYLGDTYAFFKKYLYDMYTEQKVHDGLVPVVIPAFGLIRASCGWGDAATIMPWNMYKYYGDKTILEEQFESMKTWVDYIKKVDGDNHAWRHFFHYGDWLALDNVNLKDDTVFGATDVEFLANVYYAISAGIVAKAAYILDKKKEHKEYKKLSQDQFDIIRKEYYTATGRSAIKTQTALILTLKHNLSIDEDLTKQMLKTLFEQVEDKLKTGFIGTPLLCNVLSEHGFEDLAFKLLLNREYPGWLHQISLGATTMWERWNSVNDDGSISSTGMNSLNHYANGSIVEWIFKHVGGIRMNEEGYEIRAGEKEENVGSFLPGFKKALLKPMVHWDLGYADASYESISGKYSLSWQIEEVDRIRIKVSVPFGCEAELYLPEIDPEELKRDDNKIFDKVVDGKCILLAGDYDVSYKTKGSLKYFLSTYTPIGELLSNEEAKKIVARYFNVDNIPTSYHDSTFREVGSRFSEYINDKTFYELDEALKEI